jgi:hypothetical protein
MSPFDALVAEYRALPASSNHLPDSGDNDRKCEILIELDAHANEPSVSRLLLDVLQDPDEFDLARVEAIQVAGLYVAEANPLHDALNAELERIASSADEDDMLRGWAQRYVPEKPAKLVKQAVKSAKRKKT